MKKLFSLKFWGCIAWRMTPALFQWIYANPGLIASYFPAVFTYQVFKGTAEDSAMTLTFAKTTSGVALSKAITVYGWDNPMYIQLSYDGTNYSGSIEIPTGSFFHFSQTARAAKVYNKTAGNDARFQLIAWYVISKY